MKTERNTPRRCVHCGHQSISKHGFTTSKQRRFRCRACGRTFIRYTGKRLHKIRLKRQRIQFARLMPLGNSVRDDARLLGVSHSTIWRWRHEAMQQLSRRRARRRPQPAKKTIVRRKPLFLPRMFWGKLSNNRWAERYKADFLHLYQRANSDESMTVFFTTSTTETDKLRHFSIIVQRWPNNYSLPKNVLDRIHPRAQVFEVTGTWLIPCTEPDNGHGDDKRMLWMGRASPFFSACRATQELSILFGKWMDRFRGVAVKYLELYAALFEIALARGDVKQPKWWDTRHWCRM